MFSMRRKMLTASILIATVSGMSGFIYYTALGASAAQAQGADAKSEVEALRKENDLLRRSLELALDKVRAQEATVAELTKQVEMKAHFPTYVDPFTSTAVNSAFGAQPHPTLIDYTRNLNVRSFYSTIDYNPSGTTPYMLMAAGNNYQGDPRAINYFNSTVQDLQNAKDKDAVHKAIDALEKALKELKASLKKDAAEPKKSNPAK